MRAASSSEGVEGSLPAAIAALAASQAELAAAVRAQSHLFEILVESMPATAEAKLLGISPCTVRRNRAKRSAERVLGETFR